MPRGIIGKGHTEERKMDILNIWNSKAQWDRIEIKNVLTTIRGVDLINMSQQQIKKSQFLCFIYSYGLQWRYILFRTLEVPAGYCPPFWAKCIETYKEVGGSSEDNKNYCPHFLNTRDWINVNSYRRLFMEWKGDRIRLSFYKYEQLFPTVI